MLANQMFPAALGIFMVVLVQDMGFPTWMWGILFFLPRAYDAVLDPIMGFISDNTRSKWGRRRQYVFIGAIMLGIGFVAMWQLHRADGITYNFVYFLFWSLVFFTGLTVFSIPYVAMGYEMSDDFHERTSIMAVAQWIGQWAWVIAPWFWVVMYDPKWFPNADTAARTLSVWVGVACMLLAMVPAAVPAQPLDQGRHPPRPADPGQHRHGLQGTAGRLQGGLRLRAVPQAVLRHLPDLQRLQHGGGVLVLHRRLPPVQRQHGGRRHLAHAVRQHRRAGHHLRGDPHRGLDVEARSARRRPSCSRRASRSSATCCCGS